MTQALDPSGSGSGSGSASPAGSDARDGVEEILDQHAELRDIVVEIQEATDRSILRPLVHRLAALLEAHFAHEERGGTMLAASGSKSTDERVRAARLLDEHTEILASLHDLCDRLPAEPGPVSAKVGEEVAAILARLLEHDARETDLLIDAIDVEPGADATARGARSRALEVNLRRTAVEVLIPPEHKVLLEVTAGRRGLHENAGKLLREIHHRYVGWPQTLDELHRRAMGDFAHYLRHERAPEAIAVFCDLYAMAAARALPTSLRETAIRKHLYYLEKVVREADDSMPQLLATLEHALARIGALLRGDPKLAVVASPRLKRVAQELLATEPHAATGAHGATRQSLEILGVSLRAVYAQWLAQEDPARWWREQTGQREDATLPEPLAAVSRTRLEEHRDALEALTADPDALIAGAADLLALPDDAQIQRGYLAAAACVESSSNERWQNERERIRWLIRVLAVEGLTSVHEQALSEISRTYVDVLKRAERPDLEHFVRETFAILRTSELAASPTALNLIEKIGLEVLASGDADWAAVAIDELLDWDFPSPEFAGFTEEWKARVNPSHVRAIRAYLGVIEGDPQLAKSLLAALVVQLKLGGVFVADTDLFQKDVSKLLGSDIAPVYHQLKHLLKLFPVYFSDIGAEGELREVSSRLDELAGRRDSLSHFLRKQCHVESNPQLGSFVEAVAHFWATGERAPLRRYVPPALYEALEHGDPEHAGLHPLFRRLAGDSRDIGPLFALDSTELERRLAEITATSADREKARLLFRLRKLIADKYEFDHDDLLERLARFHRLPGALVERLRSSLAEERHEDALEAAIEITEALKDIITDPAATDAIEDIYRKRHIAVGIPSLYGRYSEPKFDATGLTFRTESLANALFDRILAEDGLEYITRGTLRRVARWLNLMLRALRVDGCRGRGLSIGIAMLEQALRAERVTVDQYINIFQLISRGVEQLIRIRFIESYEPVLDRVVLRMLERGVLSTEDGTDGQTAALEISESFLRDLIAESFGLQQLDRLVGGVLRTLAQEREKLQPQTLSLLMSYDADRCSIPIDREASPLDGAVYLGNKGHQVKQLSRYGLPVPDGFILTTEIFRCHEAIRASDPLRRDVAEEIRRQVARLERLSGARFGDPDDPLLLSVRSGSAISMPGMLDTFLNVGMDEQIAEGRARRSGSPWGAWDGYRRFLQFWGMGHGLHRDLFDTLMRAAKNDLGVARKSEISGEQMHEIALRYRSFLHERGVPIVTDPYAQLEVCVEMVLGSWQSDRARAYRGAVRIAEEWGTAVIVQNMVYGNLNERSGTGVVFTCNPQQSSGDVQLYGDFIVQGQGDDVVSGLVETIPISEEQRRSEAERSTQSLEKDFPRIHEALGEHARALIHGHGMFHQEIEFTFESEDPEDLYILQTRDAVMSQMTSLPAFTPGPELERAKMANGVGAGGGALSGRVAVSTADLEALRANYPEDPIILLRPDTVPDDVPLILLADGILTARGGATSHAAVAAQRLGRTCVVGCRQLDVDETRGYSLLAGDEIATGDFLSINGIDGSIYRGKHASTILRRQRLG